MADAVRALPDGAIVHLSGCAKGCAHPFPEPLAVFGRNRRCDVFIDGAKACSVTPEELPKRIAQIVNQRGGAR
jgi:precorrin-3B synthase